MSKFRRFLVLFYILSLFATINMGYVIHAVSPDFVGPLQPGTAVYTPTPMSLSPDFVGPLQPGIIVYTPTPVPATSSSSSSTNANVSTLSEEEGKTLLAEINKEMNRGADYGTLMSVYSALITTGFNDYECTAILVNMNRESSINPTAIQNKGVGPAIGLIQWDGDRREALQTFSRGLNDTTNNLIGYQVGGIGTQVAFILEELTNQNQWISVAPNPKYTNVNFTEVTSAINDANIDLTRGVDKNTWRNMTNVVAMSMYFTSCFERCGYDIDIYNEGAKQAPLMYKLLTGTDAGTLSSSSDAGTNQELAQALVNSGLWDESKLSEFCRLTETNVQADLLDKAKRNNLSNEELYNLSSWEDNVRKDAENTGLIKIVRIITMFVGIIFTLWVILIYIAYWFDRINNFVDIDLVGILTLGKLRVSDTEDDCTFKVSSLNQSGKKTVNHRAILFICITGILFGVLIISGTLYKLLQVFVLKVLDILR